MATPVPIRLPDIETLDEEGRNLVKEYLELLAQYREKVECPYSFEGFSELRKITARMEEIALRLKSKLKSPL